MKKTTLLLDLDDTLLDTNMQAFGPAYFAALSSALAEFVSPDIMLPALTGGTRAMMENQDPARTLREVFNAHFFPRLGFDQDVLSGKIEEFYNTIFPTLGHVAGRRPDAIDFVKWAVAQGQHVAIATNPYFPLAAVKHRLDWAGLPAGEYPFALISSYETFHFTKENPAYFPEFLAQLGCPEGPVVMVGNDFDMDLLPAMKAGLAVFWLRTNGEKDHPEIPQGDFTELRRWLESVDPVEITPKFKSEDAILSQLAATPAALGTLTLNIDPVTWHKKPKEDEWCLTEVICHLRDVEIEVNLPRVQKITQGDNPFLPGVNSDEWAASRRYIDQNGMEALQVFIETRKQTVALLKVIQQPWDLPARHAIFGPTSLNEMTGISAGHDRIHIRQIWSLLKG